MEKIIFDFNRTLFDKVQGKPFAGAQELLERYSEEYELALVSKGITQDTLKTLGWDRFFSQVTIVSEKRLEHFVVHKREQRVWSVGDRCRTELMLSNQCGFSTVWIRQGKFASQEPIEEDQKPDFVITSLQQLPSIIPLRNKV